jgi:hypothetical protein
VRRDVAGISPRAAPGGRDRARADRQRSDGPPTTAPPTSADLLRLGRPPRQSMLDRQHHGVVCHEVLGELPEQLRVALHREPHDPANGQPAPTPPRTSRSDAASRGRRVATQQRSASADLVRPRRAERIEQAAARPAAPAAAGVAPNAVALARPARRADAGGAATATAWARWCRRGVHQRTVVPNVIAGAAVFKPPLYTCLDALRRRKHVHQETGGRIGGGQE